MSMAMSRMFQGMGKGISDAGETMVEIGMEKRREKVQSLRDANLNAMREKTALAVSNNDAANRATQAATDAETREDAVIASEKRAQEEKAKVVSKSQDIPGNKVQDYNAYGALVGEPRDRTINAAEVADSRDGPGSKKPDLIELKSGKKQTVQQISTMFRNEYGITTDSNGNDIFGTDGPPKETFEEYYNRLAVDTLVPEKPAAGMLTPEGKQGMPQEEAMQLSMDLKKAGVDMSVSKIQEASTLEFNEENLAKMLALRGDKETPSTAFSNRMAVMKSINHPIAAAVEQELARQKKATKAKVTAETKAKKQGLLRKKELATLDAQQSDGSGDIM